MVSNIELGMQYVDVQMGIKKVKNISVLPNLIGAPQAGYKIVNVALSPSDVVLKGPEDIINSIEALSTNPIDVSELIETAVLEADIVIPEGISIMYFEPPFSLTVTVEKVEERIFELTTDDILLKSGESYLPITNETLVNDGYSVSFGTEVSTLQLIVTDVPRVLSTLAADQFRVYVDLEGLEAGSHTVPLVAKVENQNIQVDIKPININVSLVAPETVEE